MSDIKQAHKDFAALKEMAQDAVAFADEIFGFHAQQPDMSGNIILLPDNKM